MIRFIHREPTSHHLQRLTYLTIFVAISTNFLNNAQAQRAHDQPHTVVELLDTASLQLHNRQPRKARQTLQFAQSQEPDNPWLWHYQGLASLQLHDPHRAITELDTAALNLSPDNPIEQELTNQIATARQAARREIFSASATMGFAYDTNVSFLGDSGTLDFIANKPDGKFHTSFAADYAPITDETQTLAIGTRLAHSWHFDIDPFDVQTYGGYLRYTRRFDHAWSATIRYDYDFTLLGREPFLSNHALTPSLRYDWPAAEQPFAPKTTEAYYRIQHQDFRFETDLNFDRDALTHAVGIQQSFRISPFPKIPWSCDVSTGYALEEFNTDGREFDRLEHNFLLSLDAPLLNPKDPTKYLLIPDEELRFRFTAQWQIADYKNASLNDRNADQRADLISSYGLALSQRLRSDPKRGDLTLHAVILWTDADSNITLRNTATPFTYQKVIYGLQLAWSF